MTTTTTNDDHDKQNYNNQSLSLPIENIRPTRSFSKAPTTIKIAKSLYDSFQKVERRQPPSEGKTEHIRLVTIAASAYCEKARWGLDLLESDPQSPFYYTEDCHPPLFSNFATVPLSNGKGSMVPMVLHENNNDGGQPPLWDSTVILKRYCPFLYPSECIDEIDEWEGYFGQHLGATLRCLMYHEMLIPKHYDALSELATRYSSVIETLLFRQMLDRGLARGMRKLMNINDDTARASEASIRDVFRRVSETLDDDNDDDDGKRRYLCDDDGRNVGFTAADLSFAALAGPIILPKELLGLQLDPTKMPPRLYRLHSDLRSTRAAEHVIKMYHKHRWGARRASVVGDAGRKAVDNRCSSPVRVSLVVPKCAGGRNRVPMVGVGIVAALLAGGVVTLKSNI